MTAQVLAAVCLAGGLGAVLRYVIDTWVRSSAPMSFPWGTAVVNVSGSFLLGLVTGLALTSGWSVVLGAGLLGGYTTFSTASVETVRLVLAGEHARALLSGLGVLLVGVLAALAGLGLGGLGS